MPDKYSDIKKNILKYAIEDDDIKAIVAMGSYTRETVKADEFSDLDLFIATSNIEKWYSGEYPALLGNVSISFIEPTFGGGKEKRVIYDEDKDVDMIVLTPEQFASCIKEGIAGWVMNRGYNVIYDSMNCTDLLKEYVKPNVSKIDMSEEEFTNLVNDFYFHNIWAYKKLLRGEIWSAKMCIDAYLKNYLLRMIELYSVKVSGVSDTWHDGRFLDKWADKTICEQLTLCFGHYDKDDLKKALDETHNLFSKLAKETAENMRYPFPEKAQKCAKEFLNR